MTPPLQPSEGSDSGPSPAEGGPSSELRTRARSHVYEQLALTSALIWVGCAAILMMTIVPFSPRPQRYIMLATVLPLLPAAFPWLFWGRLSDRLAQRWHEDEQKG